LGKENRVIQWWRWFWIGLGLIAVAVIWRTVKMRPGRLVEWAGFRPATWHRIPGMKTHVIAENPNTGANEMVKLPAGVTSDQVAAIGITESGGTYEVEPSHKPTDRRDVDGDSNASMDL
jgi:hypothetical protein